MSRRTLTPTGLTDGLWTGIVTGGAEAPVLHVLYRDAALSGVTVEQGAEGWHVAVPVPAEAVSDGVHTFVVEEEGHGPLGHFTLIAGDSAESDLRAEVDLLRAELETLKRAFRRHCSGSD